jgi:hypothetical protein
VLGPTRASHLKKMMTITAGISGAHQAFIPSAESEVGPSDRIINMMAAAQHKALIKLSPEN